MCRMLGYTREELLELGVQDIHPAEDMPVIGELFGRMVREGVSLPAILRVKRKDGSVFDAEIRGRSVVLGARNCLLGVFRDITERRRLEKVERESARRAEAVFAQATTGMSIVQLDGKWLRVNQRLCEMVGYPAEEMLGMGYRDITHPDDLAADLAAGRALAAGEVDSYVREKRYVHRNGATVWISLSVGLVRDDAGRPAYFVAVSDDITDRKRLEAERGKIEEQLRHAQKMEAVGTLAGGVAQEFNNLLTVIVGYSGLLMAEAPEGSTSLARIKAIRAAADRAARLTNHLLAFSRRQVHRPRPVGLGTVVAGMEEVIREQVGASVRVGLRLDPAAGMVMADLGQIWQVVLSLTANAHDAMPGGGPLTIEVANADPGGKGPAVMLAVSDTGTGMDEATKARIFEPFFTTKGVGGGMGLGLSAVLGIVQQSGGTISVESEPGHGSTFRMYLPRLEVRVAA